MSFLTTFKINWQQYKYLKLKFIVAATNSMFVYFFLWFAVSVNELLYFIFFFYFSHLWFHIYSQCYISVVSFYSFFFLLATGAVKRTKFQKASSTSQTAFEDRPQNITHTHKLIKLPRNAFIRQQRNHRMVKKENTSEDQ